MVRDYKAPFRREEFLARSAETLRVKLDVKDVEQLDMPAILRRLELNRFSENGLLKIEFYVSQVGEIPAYVQYDPLRLKVDSELWDLAEQGGPAERFVLAHELGHVILHNKYVQPFSGKFKNFSQYGMQEDSAEWQANTWAGHFLVPDQLVSKVWDPKALS